MLWLNWPTDQCVRERIDSLAEVGGAKLHGGRPTRSSEVSPGRLSTGQALLSTFSHLRVSPLCTTIWRQVKWDPRQSATPRARLPQGLTRRFWSCAMDQIFRIAGHHRCGLRYRRSRALGGAGPISEDLPVAPRLPVPPP